MSDPRLSEWIALRRVHDGAVVKSAGVYFDQGRPVPSYLTEVFDRIVWTGLVAVAEGDPVWSVRRLSLTDAGQARHAELCELDGVVRDGTEVAPSCMAFISWPKLP
ncbi:MAG: hypothetical protein LC808_14020 [Actinobacteria bacterium]|nr:hypothetical protein [Actinomycetota bacterium]